MEVKIKISFNMDQDLLPPHVKAKSPYPLKAVIETILEAIMKLYIRGITNVKAEVIE